MDRDPEQLIVQAGGLVTEAALSRLAEGILVAVDQAGGLIAILEVRCRDRGGCYATLGVYGRTQSHGWDLLVEYGDRWLSPRDARPSAGAGPACASSRTSFTYGGRCYGTVGGVVDLGTTRVGVRSSRDAHLAIPDLRTGSFVVIAELATLDETFTVHAVGPSGEWAHDEIA